jgi:hypothetical protein
MTQILVHGTVAAGLVAGLPTGLLHSDAGMILVVVVGLALLVAFGRQILFTPVEEAAPLPERLARRELPLPECYRPHGPGLFRLSRYR